jgi:predicted nucleic acid-binding protein
VQSILADAGPLIALFRARDKHHSRIRAYLRDHPVRLLTTLPVVTEAAHFLNTKGKLALIEWIQRAGLRVETLAESNITEVVPILRRYMDLDLDFADASLVWLANRTGITRILTLDRRDFEALRLDSGQAFDLI